MTSAKRYDRINELLLRQEQRVPETAKSKLLYLFIEAGEAADIIKKQGDDEIMKHPETRRHFIEEMCDTLMYFNDILLCYGITPEELEQVYLEKHEKNMKRW